jgi:hypothetical protein
VGGGERGVRPGHGRRAAEACAAAACTCSGRVGGGGGAGVVGAAMPHDHHRSSEFVCLRGLSLCKFADEWASVCSSIYRR